MSLIQTGRYEQFTRRLLRLVGGSIMPRLQNDLSPVLNIEDPSDAGLFFWRGHQLAAGRAAGTSAPLEFAEVSLFNPLNSGKIMVLLGWRANLSGGADLLLNITQSRALVPSASSFFTDSRASATLRPSAEVGFSSLAVAPTNTAWNVFNSTNGTQVEIPQFVLTPGFGFAINHQIAEAFLGVSFYWLERSAEVSEIQGA